MMVNFDLASFVLNIFPKKHVLYVFFRFLHELNFSKDEIHSFTA